MHIFFFITYKCDSYYRIYCFSYQGRRIKKHSHPKVLTDNFHPIPP